MTALIKTNCIKLFLLTSALFLSLVYNYNADFWIQKEFEYYRLFFVLVTSALLFIICSKPVKLGKIDILIVSVLILVLLSRVFRLRSFNDIYILNTISLLIYYLSIKTISLDKEEIIYYYNCVIGVGLLLSFYSLLQFYGYVDSGNYYWKMLGGFSNPAPLGGFIALVLTLVLYQLFQKETIQKYSRLLLYVLITLFLLFVLIKSASRAAMLSVLVAFFILLLAKGIIKLKKLRYVLFIIPVFLCLIIFHKGMDSVYGRLLIWKITFLSFLNNPITGIGYGFFGAHYLDFQSEYFMNGGTDREMLLAGFTEQTFNESLKFLIENGLTGILLILLCLLWILKSDESFWICVKKNSSLASLTFFSAIFVFSQLSFPFQFLSFKLLFLNQIGLQKYSPVVFVNFDIKNRLQKLLFCLVSAIILFLVNYKYEGFRFWKEASESQFSNPELSRTLYSNAALRLGNDAGFLINYANSLEETNPKEALVYYEKAKLFSGASILYKKTANLNEKLRDYKSAENDYLRIHYVSPHLFVPLEQLLDFYNRKHDANKSAYYAKKILETTIKVPSPEVMRIKQKARNQLTLK
ncbi:MAG: O-antigen ligase family protein [Flavobacterium sp.]|uniref:O-antigen ligase family protein n=1 Tax=Flavobacterium sp. TaxID=239 RepID=UPI001B17A763|nr:O-antigen ligase family protein [Flavobacterium sp.]MBO9586446.1 O-antigen ligase family protein [Flavobacterium sp.]